MISIQLNRFQKKKKSPINFYKKLPHDEFKIGAISRAEETEAGTRNKVAYLHDEGHGMHVYVQL